MYVCQSYQPRVVRDTTRVDSSRVISDQEVFLDENGEPIENQSSEEGNHSAESKSSKANETQKSSKKDKSEKEINFNDL